MFYNFNKGLREDKNFYFSVSKIEGSDNLLIHLEAPILLFCTLQIS